MLGMDQEVEKEEEKEEGEEEKKNIKDKQWSEIRLTLEELSLVQHGEKASTMAFLSLSNLLLLLLDKVGPTMAVLRLDVQRNIERLEKMYMSDALSYSALVDIMEKEMSEGRWRKSDSCTRAVLWLTRSIDFCVALLARLTNKESQLLSLEQLVEEAYQTTLKPWHGWISRAAYKIALKLIPEREVLMSLLMGKVQDQDTLESDVHSLVAVARPLLADIRSHLKTFQLDRLKST